MFAGSELTQVKGIASYLTALLTKELGSRVVVDEFQPVNDGRVRVHDNATYHSALLDGVFEDNLLRLAAFLRVFAANLLASKSRFAQRNRR